MPYSGGLQGRRWARHAPVGGMSAVLASHRRRSPTRLARTHAHHAQANVVSSTKNIGLPRGRGVPSVAGVTGGECPGPRRARCPQNVRAQAVVPMGICPESACDDRPRKTSASTDGRRCRRWDQPAGPARGQLPAAVNGFSQTLMSVALQPHAGWIVPCPRRSALTRCCVCTVRRMPRQSASKCRGLRARPALARAAWWAAINSPSPARWAVRASS